MAVEMRKILITEKRESSSSKRSEEIQQRSL